MTSEIQYELASAAELVGDDVIRGIASTIGNIDRSRRAFLPGAFGRSSKQVPLLAYHDDKRPIGTSDLTPEGLHLNHVSRTARTAFAEEMRELVRAGAIPATSIGWVSEKQYIGDGKPGEEWNEAGVRYFEDADIVENSLVPIPANPFALISQASMVTGTVDRAQIERMIEIAAGKRNSHSDQKRIQDAHDLMASLGATCSSGDDADTTSGMLPWQIAAGAVKDSGPDADGYCMRDGKKVFDPDNDGDDDSSAATDTDHDYWTPSGKLTPLGLKTDGPWRKKSASEMSGWLSDLDVGDQIRVSAWLGRAAADPKHTMPDGSYPISTCDDVHSAALLAHHSKTYSFQQIHDYVMRCKNALKCPDSVLPATWTNSSGIDLSTNVELAIRLAEFERMLIEV